VELVAQHPLREEEDGDDAHRLLRIVAAVAQRVERRRQELQVTKVAVDGERRRFAARPVDDHHDELREHESEEWRDDDADRRDAQSAVDHGAEAGLRDGGAGQPADQRVAAARGNPQVPREHVPDDRAGQRAEDDAAIDDARVHDPGADRLRHVQTEHRERDEVEERRPGNGDLRAQHARCDHGGDRVRRVVQAVQEVEQERDRNQADENREPERIGAHDDPQTLIRASP
jgi:hypothetical protein